MSESPPRKLPRRRFMQDVGGAAVVAALAPACSSSSDDSPTGAVEDDVAADTASVPDMTAWEDSVEGGDSPDGSTGPAPLPRPGVVHTMTKPPWIMATSTGLAFRFETLVTAGEAVDIPTIRLTPDEPGIPIVDVVPERTEATHTHEWPIFDTLDDVKKDEVGTFGLYTAVLNELAPGVRYTWSMALGPDSDDEVLDGAFTTSPTEARPFTIGWIADTMWPNSLDTAPKFIDIAPEVAIHGGDMTYDSAILDTWNTFFSVFAPVFANSVSSYVVGNHEFDWGDAGLGEYSEYYLRLLAPPDPAAPGPNFRAFTYAHVRFIILDSEADYEETGLDAPEGPQRPWLEAELNAASSDPSVRAIIVAFHRPVVCFGRYGVQRERLEWLHPLLLQHGVSLVLTGHNHAYERFDIDGISYVVDGGGGALLYSVDEQLLEGKVLPEEEAWRQAASRSYGCVRIDVEVDGTLNLSRIEASSGDVSDAVTLPPRLPLER